MFREIRTSERITDEDRRRLEEERRRNELFKRIKPQTDVTVEESKRFVENLFNQQIDISKRIEA